MIRIQSLFISMFFGILPALGNQFPAEPFVKASFDKAYLAKIDADPFPTPPLFYPCVTGLDTAKQSEVAGLYTFFYILGGDKKIEPVSSDLPSALWANMRLYGTGSLLNRIKRTETHAGTVMLTHLLSRPLSTSLLAHRQKVLRHFLACPDYKAFKASLKKIRTLESNIVRWYFHLGSLKNANLHPYNLVGTPVGVEIAQKFLGPVFTTLFAIGSCGGAAHEFRRQRYAEGIIGGLTGIWVTGVLANISYHQNNFLRMTQEIFISFAQLFQEAETLATLIGRNPLLRDHSDFEELLSFFKPSQQTADQRELLALLKKNTFKGSPSFWSRDANIMQARIYAVHAHDQIKSLFRGIGMIDAYASMATLIKNYAATTCPYTFVTFVDDEKPMLSIINAWSPLEDNPSHISIQCGQSHPQNTLITGDAPNVIHTLGTCALLAHTFGIAPAREAVMSHFDVFHACRTADHYGLSDRLAKITAPQQHALVLYQEDKDVPFDQFIKIVAPQLAQSGQYMVIAATNSLQALELEKLGFGNIRINAPSPDDITYQKVA